MEVKTEEKIRWKTLSIYSEEHHPKIKLRFTMRNLIRQEGLLNIPLFPSGRTRFFLDQELRKKILQPSI